MEEKQLAHKRLAKWEMFDEIQIRIVPRYKTSGMSGDEWRHHAQVDFMFKGAVITSNGFRDMETAIMMLGAAWHHTADHGIPDGVIALEKGKCDQPSCRNDAVARFVIKRHTSDDGEWLDPGEYAYHRWFRQFCRVHLQRGDCGREDADANYEPMDGITAEESTNTQESPSAFGGVVLVGM
jgi:hypothetical protein